MENSLSLKHATVLGHVPREFSWVFWHSASGTERPSLKLPIEESVLPGASSLRYCLTRFARKLFNKRMRLTRDGKTVNKLCA